MGKGHRGWFKMGGEQLVCVEDLGKSKKHITEVEKKTSNFPAIGKKVMVSGGLGNKAVAFEAKILRRGGGGQSGSTIH